MRTAIFVGGGLLLLGACLLAGHWLDASAHASILIYVVVWFAAVAVNLTIGVVKAGYTVREELPIAVLSLCIPWGVAGMLFWKLQ